MMTTVQTEHLKREFIRSDSEYLRRFATASVAHATDARMAATQVVARTSRLLKTLSETWTQYDESSGLTPGFSRGGH